MATISNVKVQWGYTATSTPAAISGAAAGTVGTALSRKEYTDADIFYSFEITSTGSLDVATLTMSSGAIAKTTGTPDVTRWGTQTSDLTGEDSEGVVLPTMVTLYGLAMEAPSTNTGYINLTPGLNDSIPNIADFEPDRVLELVFRTGISTLGTYAFLFEVSGDVLNGTIWGKSS